MTGKELWELLRPRMPSGFYIWGSWDDARDDVQQAMEEVTDILNEIQGDAIFAATAGEDI